VLRDVAVIEIEDALVPALIIGELKDGSDMGLVPSVPAKGYCRGTTGARSAFCLSYR
jgi:hypothetical protein